MSGKSAERRCTYAQCEKPTESSHYYRIDGDKTTGGHDWAKIAGNVLCHPCYMRFKRRGTLERSDPFKIAVSDRRCTNAGCDKPTESDRFYRIDGDTKAGGRDWSGIAGSVLCNACYVRFKQRGTLERSGCHRGSSRGKPPGTLAEGEKRCSNTGCDNPTGSGKFYRVHGDSKAGGWDWSALAGNVLCNACYVRFKQRGRLEKSDAQTPLASREPPSSERRCTYSGCDKPTESSFFYHIKGDRKTGGQNWSEIAGSVLCHACYCRYKNRGTLEKSDIRKTVASSEKQCSYARCDKPTESKQFYKVDGESKAGGRDWTALAGKVLCNSCYRRFKQKGSLEKRDSPRPPISSSSAGDQAGAATSSGPAGGEATSSDAAGEASTGKRNRAGSAVQQAAQALRELGEGSSSSAADEGGDDRDGKKRKQEEEGIVGGIK